MGMAEDLEKRVLEKLLVKAVRSITTCAREFSSDCDGDCRKCWMNKLMNEVSDDIKKERKIQAWQSERKCPTAPIQQMRQ